jgi:hypothetical protein
MLAGSGVLAIIVAGTGLATLTGGATPALAATVPVTVTPSIAMPGLPVTFTIACGSGVKSATLFGKTVNLSGPVAMKSTRGGTFAVTVNLPTGMSPGAYQALAGCESGDYGTANLTVNAPPTPSPSPTPSPRPTQTYRPPPPPPPTGAPVTGDGATSIAGGLGVTTAAGLGLLGAGGVAGLAAIRRFRGPRR